MNKTFLLVLSILIISLSYRPGIANAQNTPPQADSAGYGKRAKLIFDTLTPARKNNYTLKAIKNKITTGGNSDNGYVRASITISLKLINNSDDTLRYADFDNPAQWIFWSDSNEVIVYNDRGGNTPHFAVLQNYYVAPHAETQLNLRIKVSGNFAHPTTKFKLSMLLLNCTNDIQRKFLPAGAYHLRNNSAFCIWSDEIGVTFLK